MYPSYNDITDGLGKPDWYDQHGAPRYGAFHPHQVTVYSKECALIRIQCQSCNHPADVAIVAATGLDIILSIPEEELTAEEYKKRQYLDRDTVYYGDAPNCDYAHYQQRCAGTTMGSIPIAVVEWWRNTDNEGWKRLRKREGSLD